MTLAINIDNYRTKSIYTTWNAWNEESLKLNVPYDWKITEYSLPSDDCLNKYEVEERIIKAFEIKKIRLKLESSQNACILVDDITRPTCWEVILECIISQLNKKNISNDCIHILITNAGHAQMSYEELSMKLGENVLRRISVTQHLFDCKYTFIKYMDNSVGINSVYCDADFKIALGTLIPHPFAGFSGGGKAVMPGITNIETIKRNHFLVNFGLGKICAPDTEIRNQMEDIAELSGLDLLLNVTCNASRAIVTIHAGVPRETYIDGITFAKRYYETNISQNHNILILNAYPKDNELLQVSNAFNVVNTLCKKVKDSIRAVVIIARLCKGIGYHAIYGPEGELYRNPAKLRTMNNIDLIFFSPFRNMDVFHQVFHDDYFLINNWDKVIKKLLSYNLNLYNIGFFHQASMQACKK